MEEMEELVWKNNKYHKTSFSGACCLAGLITVPVVAFDNNNSLKYYNDSLKQFQNLENHFAKGFCGKILINNKNNHNLQ